MCIRDSGGWAREDHALFINQRGTRLTPQHIRVRLKQRSLKAGLATPVHPHMLRHSFASHVLQSSGDLRAVQELLGHANITTTQVYTRLDFQHLAKVYDRRIRGRCPRPARACRRRRCLLKTARHPKRPNKPRARPRAKPEQAAQAALGRSRRTGRRGCGSPSMNTARLPSAGAAARRSSSCVSRPCALEPWWGTSA